MTADDVLRLLAQNTDLKIATYLTRVGLREARSFGIPTPTIKKIASEIRKSADDPHGLAADLWETGNYDARVVAFLIDDPGQVTDEQMDRWCSAFDNWGTVDGTCCYLFCRTPYSYLKAFEWADREPELEKRAAFALMAYIALHDKKAEDEALAAFLPVIELHAYDERNFVKKAVNWALRQIGKRNLNLNRAAIETAHRIQNKGTRSGRWIAADALRELESPAVRTKLAAREEA